MQIYVVKRGDTVDSIASGYGVEADTIIADNQLIYPYPLAIGQTLLIADGTSSSTKTACFCDGYAYPFISPWILEQTLPYLSSLLVFSYGFSADGTLNPPEVSPEWMLTLANTYQVAPILVLTPFGADGNFNNNLISQIVYNDVAKYTLIGNLLTEMNDKGYQGLDIDFEYIKAEDRDAFTEFVQDVSYEMRQNGYTVSIALAPKTSATQQGLLYQGKDYASLGAATDHSLIMTYEWGYTYGPPMAVAPIDKVRQVVAYAVTEISANKINLGIPNYGYDWPLPYVRNQTAATTIGNAEAVQIAIENNVPIQFDETAQSPYFTYVKNGITHEVWFEDVRSMQAKFDLIKEYNLRGMSYWTIMKWWRANWLLLEDNFRIQK